MRTNKYGRKLTPVEVVQILEEATTPCPCCKRPPLRKEVAERYGVSSAMVTHILTGRAWALVPFRPADDQ